MAFFSPILKNKKNLKMGEVEQFVPEPAVGSHEPGFRAWALRIQMECSPMASWASESAREHQTLQPVCPVLNNENSRNHCVISSLVRC